MDKADQNTGTMAQPIVDQIIENAPHPDRARRHPGSAVSLCRRRIAKLAPQRDQAGHRLGQIHPDRRRRACLVLRQEQRVVEQRRHFVEITHRPCALFRIVDIFGAQPQPGQIGPHVMRDRGKHTGALLHQLADPRLHVVERSGQLADLARAGERQVRRVEIGPEMPHAPGKLGDRPRRLAHRERQDEQHHQSTDRAEHRA